MNEMKYLWITCGYKLIDGRWKWFKEKVFEKQESYDPYEKIRKDLKKILFN